MRKKKRSGIQKAIPLRIEIKKNLWN